MTLALGQVLEYLKKHHEFDKTSASTEDRLVGGNDVAVDVVRKKGRPCCARAGI